MCVDVYICMLTYIYRRRISFCLNKIMYVCMCLCMSKCAKHVRIHKHTHTFTPSKYTNFGNIVVPVAVVGVERVTYVY